MAVGLCGVIDLDRLPEAQAWEQGDPVDYVAKSDPFSAPGWAGQAAGLFFLLAGHLGSVSTTVDAGDLGEIV